MDGLALVQRARAAGLAIEIDGDKLRVRGPRRVEAMLRLLSDHKPAVMAVLAEAAD